MAYFADNARLDKVIARMERTLRVMWPDNMIAMCPDEHKRWLHNWETAVAVLRLAKETELSERRWWDTESDILTWAERQGLIPSPFDYVLLDLMTATPYDPSGLG